MDRESDEQRGGRVEKRMDIEIEGWMDRGRDGQRKGWLGKRMDRGRER